MTMTLVPLRDGSCASFKSPTHRDRHHIDICVFYYICLKYDVDFTTKLFFAETIFAWFAC